MDRLVKRIERLEIALEPLRMSLETICSHEQRDNADDMIVGLGRYFDGLTFADCRRLLDLLPALPI